MSSQDPFFKVKRSTKKNTAIEKYKRNGKYTTRGIRVKQAMIASSQRANDDLNLHSPRETVVGTVLNRDKMQSIALPPTLQKERIRMSKNPNAHSQQKPKKPVLNTHDDGTDDVMEDEYSSDSGDL
jgi:hypothetical protein